MSGYLTFLFIKKNFLKWSFLRDLNYEERSDYVSTKLPVLEYLDILDGSWGRTLPSLRELLFISNDSRSLSLMLTQNDLKMIFSLLGECLVNEIVLCTKNCDYVIKTKNIFESFLSSINEEVNRASNDTLRVRSVAVKEMFSNFHLIVCPLEKEVLALLNIKMEMNKSNFSSKCILTNSKILRTSFFSLIFPNPNNALNKAMNCFNFQFIQAINNCQCKLKEQYRNIFVNQLKSMSDKNKIKIWQELIVLLSLDEYLELNSHFLTNKLSRKDHQDFFSESSFYFLCRFDFNDELQNLLLLCWGSKYSLFDFIKSSIIQNLNNALLSLDVYIDVIFNPLLIEILGIQNAYEIFLLLLESFMRQGNYKFVFVILKKINYFIWQDEVLCFRKKFFETYLAKLNKWIGEDVADYAYIEKHWWLFSFIPLDEIDSDEYNSSFKEVVAFSENIFCNKLQNLFKSNPWHCLYMYIEKTVTSTASQDVLLVKEIPFELLLGDHINILVKIVQLLNEHIWHQHYP